MAARKFFYVCAGMFLLSCAFHLGLTTASAQSPANPEVAVLSGSVGEDESLPLPKYRDGTQALPSECQWIVSQGHVALTRFENPILNCEAQASNVGPVLSSLTPDDPNDRSRANYMIIAVRGATLPTPTQQQSWGQLKSRYAPSHAPTSQSPTNR